jgi:hypothetical protein
MKIQNLQQLAGHLGADQPTPASISRRLYKDTTSGISFAAGKFGVTLAGYCEGDVGDCPLHQLNWGFTTEQFDKAVEQADKDGCDLWNETHGCENCKTEEVDGQKPIDPRCESCHGDGQII